MTERETQNPRPTEAGAEDNGRPRVRDRRRIDPQTYELRDPDAGAAGPVTEPAGEGAEQTGQPAGPDSELAGQVEKLSSQLADRTADLQRVQAEYVNYKRRVDRDRDLARASGIESVLRDLLGVLDSLKSAREHEELTGGFKAVAEEIEKLAARHGLESFGEPGDPFDPRIHDALMHAQADGITGPTAVTILQPGYKIKDRVIRPARVAVAEPEEAAPAAQKQPTTEPTTEAGAEDDGGSAE